MVSEAFYQVCYGVPSSHHLFSFSQWDAQPEPGAAEEITFWGSRFHSRQRLQRMVGFIFIFKQKNL